MGFNPKTRRTAHPSPQMRRPRLQFGLRSVMLVTLLICVLAATWSALIGDRDQPSQVFVVVAIAGPLGLMIGISLLQALSRLLAMHHARRSRPPD